MYYANIICLPTKHEHNYQYVSNEVLIQLPQDVSAIAIDDDAEEN